MNTIQWIYQCAMDINLGKLQEILKDRGAWWATVHEVAEIHTRLSTTTTMIINDTHRHQDRS